MRYDNPNLRDSLASEYVLGNLSPLSRKRFEALAAQRPDWSLAVNWWSYRLHLLADTVPAITPSKKVWNKIVTRLYGKQNTSSLWWNSFDWWRGLALGSASLTAVLVVVMITRQPEIVEIPVRVAVQVPVEVQVPATVALLADENEKPGWILALAKNKAGENEVRVTSLTSLKQVSDKSFELWILPPDKSVPVSVGLLPQKGNSHVFVSEKTAALLLKSGLAVSVEPLGGSPTGKPTGAVLYQGKLKQI